MNMLTSESKTNHFFSIPITNQIRLTIGLAFIFIMGLSLGAIQNQPTALHSSSFQAPPLLDNNSSFLTSDILAIPAYSKIMASDGGVDDRFGGAIAIDGNVVVIASPRDDDKGTDAGAVYIFYRSGSNWIQAQKLTASDGTAEDRFGRSVAISGKTIIIGADLDNDKGLNSGSAYVFQSNRNIWSQVAKLTAFDGSISDRFGWAVDISGNTIVVGAYQDDDVCPSDQGCNSGSAYIFETNQGGTNQWGLLKKLVASDALEADMFARALAIDVNTLVIGAQSCDECIGGSDNVPGKAYIFERNQGGTNNWGEAKILMASDAALGDDFSKSLDITENTIVIGAPSNDDFGGASGAGYVFVRDWGGTNNWGEVKKITPSDSQAGDNFGWGVAIRGDNIVIGSYWDDLAGADSGSAYLFGRNIGGADNWGQSQKFIPDDGSSGDYFGSNVSISDNKIAISAPFNDENDIDAGAAYIFSTR